LTTPCALEFHARRVAIDGDVLEWSRLRDEPGAWLVGRTLDFWLACAGGGALLLVVVAVLHWHGDRELTTADLLLGELHLGATYDAVVRGRLWRRMPIAVLGVPAAITAATYGLMVAELSAILTTIVLYTAIWHRGRQNFGIARWYQARMGGPLSLVHRRLFRAAIYLPMATGALYFANTAPLYEGDEFVGLSLDPALVQGVALVAVLVVGAYLAYEARHRRRIHPGERWIVVANALAFGSSYVVGAWSVSFIFVLTVFHEVQYLYFTYSRMRGGDGGVAHEAGRLASFAVWPLLGLASWAVCRGWDNDWVAAFLVGGLLSHYWLDGRIWTPRARRLAATAA
jgi:hypothetical protein